MCVCVRVYTSYWFCFFKESWLIQSLIRKLRHQWELRGWLPNGPKVTPHRQPSSVNSFMRHHGVGEKAGWDKAQEKPSPGQITKYVALAKSPHVSGPCTLFWKTKGLTRPESETHYMLPIVDIITGSHFFPTEIWRQLIILLNVWLLIDLTNQSKLVHEIKPICNPKIIWFLKSPQTKMKRNH